MRNFTIGVGFTIPDYIICEVEKDKNYSISLHSISDISIVKQLTLTFDGTPYFAVESKLKDLRKFRTGKSHSLIRLLEVNLTF